MFLLVRLHKFVLWAFRLQAESGHRKLMGDTSFDGMWEKRPRVADWFARIKARPSFKAISEYPPSDYDDTGRDGLKSWPRIKELIAA